LIFFKEENEEKLIPKIPLMVVAIVEQIFGKKKRPQFNTQEKLTKITDGLIT